MNPKKKPGPFISKIRYLQKLMVYARNINIKILNIHKYNALN